MEDTDIFSHMEDTDIHQLSNDALLDALQEAINTEGDHQYDVGRASNAFGGEEHARIVARSLSTPETEGKTAGRRINELIEEIRERLEGQKTQGKASGLTDKDEVKENQPIITCILP